MQRRVDVWSNCFGAICIVIAKDKGGTLALLLDMQQHFSPYNNTMGARGGAVAEELS
jgi:hypothetical protein